MRVIDHKAFSKRQKHTAPLGRKKIIRIAGILLALFVLANAIMAFVYRNKALPGYSIGGVSIAGQSYGDIESVIQESLIPKEITVTTKDHQKKLVVADLGVQVDKQKTFEAIKDKPLVPLITLVKKTQVSFVLQVDNAAVDAAIASLKPLFAVAPTNRHVSFNGSAFVAAEATKGYELHTAKTKKTVLRDLAASKTNSVASLNTLPAGDNNIDISADAAALNKQLQTDINFTANGKQVVPTKSDVGSWYVPTGNTMALSDEKINAYLEAIAQKSGVQLANGSDLLTAVKYALPKQLKSHVQMAAVGGSKVKTYCVASKGAPQSQLADVVGKLALTYADTRGWNASGAIAFKHVESGCSYTVWLTAPALMTTFGEICDDFYNCQVGTNVIINSDRWQQATEPWRQTGQDLETYRLLIINHETGHRLGFRDNNVCSGAGQAAPVMMQQSIDLKGCVFNVWPLPSELATLKSML